MFKNMLQLLTKGCFLFLGISYFLNIIFEVHFINSLLIYNQIKSNHFKSKSISHILYNIKNQQISK